MSTQTLNAPPLHSPAGQSFATPRESAAERDRRRRRRLSAPTIGYLVPEGANGGFDPNDEPLEIRITDISRLGAGFISATHMNPGDVCRIRVGLGPMRLARRMRVVNCKPEKANHFRIGAEFA